MSVLNSLISNESNIYHKQIYDKLDYFILNQKIPNIIFHGVSGTGKKTIVHNFLNKIYGNEDKQKIKTNIMIVNCCHGKGIKFIREELKFFSKMNVQHNNNNIQHPKVSFKSIVLFNADYLTIDEKSSLMRCIELFSHNTRFFIVVENIHKLLNPIISRFCEIYVPELLTDMIFSDKNCIDKNNNIIEPFINLHKLEILENIKKDNEPDISKNNNNIIIAKIKEINDILTKESCENDYFKNIQKILIQTSEFFYENGISGIDILAYIKNNREITESIKIKLDFFFHKTKKNFRCEKLFLFYLLWKLFYLQKI